MTCKSTLFSLFGWAWIFLRCLLSKSLQATACHICPLHIILWSFRPWIEKTINRCADAGTSMKTHHFSQLKCILLCIADILLWVKHALSQFYSCCMTDIFLQIIHPVLTEITSALHELLSEKNKLSLNFTNTAWHKYFCFSVITHWVFTEITSILQKLFSEKKLLNLNTANAAWHITEIILWKPRLFKVIMHWVLAETTSILQKLFSERNLFSLNFVSVVWQLWQKLSFITEISQKLTLLVRIM